MRNKITDLNNHLFAQLERLSDEDISAEALDKEIARSKSIVQVSSQIVETSRVTLDAMKLMEKAGVDISHTAGKILELKEPTS